jgi:hypothetical protein
MVFDQRSSPQISGKKRFWLWLRYPAISAVDGFDFLCVLRVLCGEISFGCRYAVPFRSSNVVRFRTAVFAFEHPFIVDFSNIATDGPLFSIV